MYTCTFVWHCDEIVLYPKIENLLSKNNFYEKTKENNHITVLKYKSITNNKKMTVCHLIFYMDTHEGFRDWIILTLAAFTCYILYAEPNRRVPLDCVSISNIVFFFFKYRYRANEPDIILNLTDFSHKLPKLKMAGTITKCICRYLLQ